VVGWAATKDVYFTRSRPYKKNDQATVESKNNHLVRRYGFYYRYDTPAELAALRELWPMVNDLLNYFTATKKPIGWSQDRRRAAQTPPRRPGHASGAAAQGRGALLGPGKGAARQT
jgi:hypothetical protein